MASTPSGTLTTTLNYYLEPSRGGESVFYPGTAGDKRRKHVPVEVKIKDLRSLEQTPTLDREGFQLVRNGSREKDFDNEERIARVYYDESAELMKKHTSASQVIVLSHVVRILNWSAAFEAEKALADGERFIGPTYGKWVHVDQSYDGAHNLMKYSFPEHYAKIYSPGKRVKRWAICNIWRPIHYEATNNALAVCDARTVPESHLRPLTAMFPKKGAYEPEPGPDEEPRRDSKDLIPEDRDPKRLYNCGNLETWAVTPPEHDGQHKWFYVSEMTPEEALLLKIFDSEDDGRVARRTPHSAFAAAEDYGRDRHSIECRCLVLWEDDDAS